MAAREERKPGPATSTPQPQDVIERIYYFEHLCPYEADNDNTKPHAPRQTASACFDSWAMPEYMRN